MHDELLYQLQNLQALGRFYREGHFSTYRLTAMVLRMLLVRSGEERPLVEQCLADPVLPTLAVSGPHLSPGKVRAPADLRIGPSLIQRGTYIHNDTSHRRTIDAVAVGEMFTDKVVPLSQWLDQVFLEPPLTLRSFIDCIGRDDGGAHLELTFLGLDSLRACGFLQWPLIASMAIPVADCLRSQLTRARPGLVLNWPPITC